MSNRVYFTSEPVSEQEPIEELSGVRLRQPIDCEGGRLPTGAAGTIVAVHAAGEAYSIEFEEPFHALVTTRVDQVEPIAGESRGDLASSLGIADR